MTLFATLTLGATEQAVEYVDGVFTRVLDAGRHRRPRRATYQRVGLARRLDQTALQEVPTADGVALRVTAAVVWAVTDARRFVEVAVAPFDAVYLAVQIALREAVGELEAERTLTPGARAELGRRLTAAARVAGEPVGVGVDSVVVKDVLLPPELRAAHAELLTARARGLAQLEVARAETAALRSLANGAKLLDDHPALARLRLVQSLPPGARVEILARED